MSERVRMTLALPRSTKDRMEELQELSEATNLTEVIRRSLAAYELLVKHVKAGNEIVIRQPDGAERGLEIVL